MSDAFASLKATTRCPFAKRSDVVEAPEWDRRQSFEFNVAAHSRALRAFSARIDEERLDGFAAFVATDSEVPGFESVRGQFGRYLFALAQTDETCRAAMGADMRSPDWQFTHSGVRFFLNVFAGFYPALHSKHAPVEGGFLVFFQPEQSFEFCPGPPLREFKHVIRRRFAEAGMPYDGERIDKRIEADLYMFPIEVHGAPVRWWDTKEVNEMSKVSEHS